MDMWGWARRLLDFSVNILGRTIVVLTIARFLIQNPLISIRPREGLAGLSGSPRAKTILCLARWVHYGYCVVYPFLLNFIWVHNSLWLAFRSIWESPSSWDITRLEFPHFLPFTPHVSSIVIHCSFFVIVVTHSPPSALLWEVQLC